MPLTVSTIPGANPTPQVVSPATVVQRAQKGGSANATLAIAYTDPILNINQTALSYRQRQGATGPEFSFDTGALKLTLRQEVLVSNALSVCAQQKWIAHEQGHVSDNQKLLSQMDGEIRSDPALRPIFISQTWFLTTAFAATQQKIHNTVAAIFGRLTAQAAALRDTRAEYARVQRDILQNCPGPYIYEVNRGDTLSQIADFFYGRASAWKAIYHANQGIIGNNPDKILVGQQLTIPRTP